MPQLETVSLSYRIAPSVWKDKIFKVAPESERGGYSLIGIVGYDEMQQIEAA
jgi:hypothetical protein